MRTPYGSRRREVCAIRSTNLSWNDSGLTDLDYLTARGISCSKLGAALERLKFAQEYGVYEHCVELISHKFQRRTKHTARRSLVTAALREFVNDQCLACGGRGSVTLNGGVSINCINCIDCEGRGLRKYTDAERAHAASVKLSCWAHYKNDYTALLDCLRSAIGAHRRSMSRVLAETTTA